jgi:hypothetical protein
MKELRGKLWREEVEGKGDGGGTIGQAEGGSDMNGSESSGDISTRAVVMADPSGELHPSSSAAPCWAFLACLYSLYSGWLIIVKVVEPNSNAERPYLGINQEAKSYTSITVLAIVAINQSKFNDRRTLIQHLQ